MLRRQKTKHKLIPLIFLFLFAAALITSYVNADGFGDPNAGEKINWQVIANGATNGTSTNYGLQGTIGQPAIGSGSSTNYGLNQGFWQNFDAPPPPCMCGDADGSGAISIGDAVFIINYIFGGGPAPNPLCLGDADGSGALSIGDAVFIINYIFGGGPAPSGC